MKIKLNDAELFELKKTKIRDRSKGGFQTMMVDFRMRLSSPFPSLVLDSVDIEKIRRYAAYDDGGYESRLKKIFGRHFTVI